LAAKDDLSFVYEQARRYIIARPWERLAGASLYLDLKVGSWHSACAQHVGNGPMSALLVFPGHRNMLDLQRAGLAEPPAGTIFVELVDDRDSPHVDATARQYGWPADLRPIPFFKTITPDGWLPLDRSQTRLLALAFAAISDFDSARNGGVHPGVAGKLTMPESTRGRYRASPAPADDDRMVPLMGMPRADLYGDADCTLSFTAVSWSEYRELRARALLCRPAKGQMEERGESVPLVTISGSGEQAADIAQKLNAAEPLGVAFGELDGTLTAILVGLKQSYVLIEAHEQREELMLWRHTTRSSAGGYAVVVEDAGPDPQSGDLTTHSVRAIFECGSAED
jgi:hypothetical protein